MRFQKWFLDRGYVGVGDRALTCGSTKCAAIDELRVIRELHVSTMEELGVECAEVHELMHELQQLVTGIALMRELTPRSSDYLVSFGERCSTRIFAAYLNSLGVPSKQVWCRPGRPSAPPSLPPSTRSTWASSPTPTCWTRPTLLWPTPHMSFRHPSLHPSLPNQFDAFRMGVITTDEFTNADVLDETYPAAVSCPNLSYSLLPLHSPPESVRRVPHGSDHNGRFDAFHMGVITTDEFTNADVLDETYPAVAESLLSAYDAHREAAAASDDGGGVGSRAFIPVVTGFLGRGKKTGATTTLGRGGSDLTATIIGRALGLREVQVWKDVDGVLTCNPNLHRASPLRKPPSCHTLEYLRRLNTCFSSSPPSPCAMTPRPALPQGKKTGATTTLGRGGSDLTATIIGRALGLREVQVWKDVDGVLTCDPNLYRAAIPVPFLTFEEASELAYFGAQVLHPQSMRPAREGNIPVRVKNSYNRIAPGTLITQERDLSSALLTSIVVKRGVTLLDLVSLRMLGQFGFLAKVFAIFEAQGISVDVVATSEVSLSLTLDPAKLWSRELIQQELDKMVEELERVAVVKLLQRRSIISLIGNVSRSSVILEKVFGVFRRNGTNVQMISQGASKVNIALVVDDDEATELVQLLHKEFFGV
ncbi:unnamed protein product [Closterium sp. Yama58-4]|nr:unnamed protein product [Closterium sp. Yama58-4]